MFAIPATKRSPLSVATTFEFVIRESELIVLTKPATLLTTALSPITIFLTSHALTIVALSMRLATAAIRLVLFEIGVANSIVIDSINAVLPSDTIKRLTENGIIEIAPLAYMRGRTLSNSVIILDEAQNTTSEQMKMFLTRMGENSKVFVTGDPSQVDLPKKTPSGFLHALNLLRGVEGISIAELTSEDVVRNGLVKKIIQAYENEER